VYGKEGIFSAHSKVKPVLPPQSDFIPKLGKEGRFKMSTEHMVLAFAGSFILISLILSQLWSPYWLLFTAFVGANLFQSAFTGFCPLAKILKAMGTKPSSDTFKY
jgi:hypothetical protein